MASIETMVAKTSARIQSLVSRHADLERTLAQLSSSPAANDSEMKRIKKLKLHIKQEIQDLRGGAASVSSV